MCIGTILYRYDGTSYISTSGINLALSQYRILRETKCGYWVTIVHPYTDSIEKWVSKAGKKRLCYPTKMEAVTNLYHRRKRHLKILQAQIKQSQQIMDDCGKMKNKIIKEQNDFINNNTEF